MIILRAPKYFTINYVETFIKEVQETFSWKQKMIPNVDIDLSKVMKIDILGLLILYKYIDYTYTHYCFKKPNLTVDAYINEAWSKYEFEELIQAYLENRGITERAYKDFKVRVEDKFIIAPQALLRNTNYTNDYLKKEFIPKIESYYKDSSKCVDIIFSCFSEILLNFWEHAVNDTKSVILADGNKSKIEIACADTGTGIVENMNNLYKGKIKKNELLKKAVEKGVTSKPNSNHMGFGLWLVNQLIIANKGRMYIYSQGYFYENNFGKIKYGNFAYWPGTIIYININLNSPKNISDIIQNTITKELKINFTS